MSTVDIPINLLSPNPLNPRKRTSDTVPEDDNGKKLYQTIEGLAQSISDVGLINPLVVEKLGSSYVIIAGERRYEACKLLGMTTVRCEVIDTDELTKQKIMGHENLKRKDWTIVEEGEYYYGISTGWKKNPLELSKILDTPKSRIYYAINAYTKLSPQVQQMVQSGEIDEKSTRALTRLHSNPELQLKVAQEISKVESNQFDKAKELVQNVRSLPLHIKQKLTTDETYGVTDAMKDANTNVYLADEETPVEKTYDEFLDLLDTFDSLITPTNVSSFKAIDKINMKQRLIDHVMKIKALMEQIDYL